MALALGRGLVARAFVLSCVVAFVAACGGGGDDSSSGNATPGGDVSGEVVVDGSSTVGPIAEAAAEEFGKVSDVNVVVGISGTGGGFEKFCRGETDVSNASRPIRREELQLCTDSGIDMTELSIGYDGLTVVVNPSNTWATCLTFTQLKMIFDEGSTASTWDQIDPSFPSEAITIYSPGADSGTFDFFTEEVNGVVDRARTDGVTFSEDDNVLVQGVENSNGAIGYFGYAYYVANQDKLKALQLNRDITRDGLPVPTDQQLGCVAPDESTVKNITYSLSRPLYMYANNKSLTDKAQVRAYLDFVLSNPQLVSDVGYVQLDAAIYTQNLTKLNAVN